MSAFSDNFSLLRRERGISQRQAALDFGVSQALLSHYENGIREPKLDFIIRACDYYGVSADYILGRTAVRDNPMTLYSGDSEDISRLMDSIAAALSAMTDSGQGRQAADYLSAAVFKLTEADPKLQTVCDGYMKLIEAQLERADINNEKLNELTQDVLIHINEVIK